MRVKRRKMGSFAALVAMLIATTASTARAQNVWTSLPGPIPSEAKSTPSSPTVTLGQPIAQLGRPVARAQHRSTPVAPHLLPVAYQEKAQELTNGSRPLTPYAQQPERQSVWPKAHLELNEDEPSTGFAVDRVLGAPIPVQQPTVNPGLGMEEAEEPLAAGAPLPGPVLAPGPQSGWLPPGDMGVVPGPTPGFVGGPEPIGPGPGGPDFGGCLPSGMAGDPPVSRFYGSAEYLMWWTDDDRNIPALATTSTNPASAGILGRDTTQVLFGGALERSLQSGGRFTLGRQLGGPGGAGIETTWFFLGERSDTFLAGNPDFPVLARPFFSVDMGMQLSQIVAFPGQAIGSLAIQAPTQLWGAELNVRRPVCYPFFSRLDCLFGFRYMNLSEGLFIQENINLLPTAIIPAGSQGQPGSTVIVRDGFQTHNQFYGGQVGLQAEIEEGPWSVNFLGKIALGYTHQVAKVSGSQTILNPDGTTATANGGLLALSSNIGTESQNRFAVVPELGVTLGYQLSRAVKLTVGYSFIYWSSVLRPSGVVDPVVDANLIPNFLPQPTTPTGLNRPARRTDPTDFWAHGINFGLHLRY